MSAESLIDALAPVLERLQKLDLNDTGAAKETLDLEFPLHSEFGDTLRALAKQGLEEGWLCGKEAGPSRFSRVAKPEAAKGFSIDAVMLWGDGPWHKHLKGEVNCMLAWEGEPAFCGFKEGWAVFEPGSQHIPSVKGGKMLIFYLLPEGAVEWKKA
ncbi:MAG: DUF4863 family protein [Planctomycetota bacterium]|nr:DUF4863 family protein [Planctomycetota bacterium]